MAHVEDYFGNKAGLIWKVLSENGPLNSAAIKRRTKLSDAELYGGLGWLARENKIEIVGNLPMLFKFKLKG